MNKTSIILLSYNTEDYTRLCIESIRNFTSRGSYELIVIDNASRDGSLAYLRAQKDLRLVENAENRGFPAACNQGMALAMPRNDLLLLNSDTIVTPHWLENLQAALHSAENIGAAGCVTNSCSHFQQIPVSYADLDEMLAFAERFNVSQPALWQPWHALTAFCLLVRRKAYAEVGGFDEAFSPGNYEDDDLCIRLRDAGYSLLLCQDTFIHHFGSASFRKDEDAQKQAEKERRYKELSLRNVKYFCEKHQLFPDWNMLHGILTAVPGELLGEGRRLLLVGMSVCTDAYIQRAAHPGLRVSCVTWDRDAAARTQQDLAIRYAQQTAESLAAALSDLQEMYDVIVIPGGLGDLPEAAQMRDVLGRHLVPGGGFYEG